MGERFSSHRLKLTHVPNIDLDLMQQVAMANFNIPCTCVHVYVYICICAYNIFSAVAMIAAPLCCPCIAPRVVGGICGAVAPIGCPADRLARVTLLRAEPPGEVFGAEVLVVAGVTGIVALLY